MDAPVNRFICLLKKSGVRISPSETIDAMQALEHVTLGERDVVRAVLRSTHWLSGDLAACAARRAQWKRH